jgi:DNA-binding response OmpR family regulator
VSARLLLVEDEAALLAILKAAVDFGGFESEFVTRGSDAIEALERGTFDAVLLDLGLPDMPGQQLLPVLRDITDAPIIVVSGRGTEQDKIEALDLGADDYVAKPFLPGELLARIRAALRRAPARAAREDKSEERQPLRVGSMVLDPLDRTVKLADRTIEFNRAEYRLLRRLAAEPGEIVPRAALLEVLYGEEAPPETRIVDVYVSRIRGKLRQLPGGEELITSVRGVGWVLRAPE